MSRRSLNDGVVENGLLKTEESGFDRLVGIGDLAWDEYEVEVPVATELIWSVRAEFEPRVWIFDGNAGCAGAAELASSAALGCDDVEVSASVNPGTYWLVTGPSAFTDAAACPARYNASLTERPLGFLLSLDRDGLGWTSQVGAVSYDVVRGDLGQLRSTAGDFVSATEECLSDNHPSTTLPYTLDPQQAGKGFWFLIRGVGATGVGTYDTGDPGQAAPRDAGINASPNGCP